MQARWNLLKAAGLGAAVGAGLAVINLMQGGSHPVEYMAGNVLGGAVACAVIFGLVAGARNLFVKAR